MEIHPAGWLDGNDTPGNLGGVADVSPPGDMISQITINWGQTGIEYNFGELLPGSIRGRVHADDGPDCDFDDPHHMLEGVRIDLLDGNGNVIATTFTNADGEYAFTGLRPGTYSVREHQPDEYFDGGERVGSLGGDEHDVRRRVQHLHRHQHRLRSARHSIRLLRKAARLDQRPRARRRRTRTATSIIRRFCSKAS